MSTVGTTMSTGANSVLAFPRAQCRWEIFIGRNIDDRGNFNNWDRRHRHRLTW